MDSMKFPFDFSAGGMRYSNAEQRGRQAGIFDVAKNLLGLDVPIEKIVKSTGLTRKEVEGLLQ